VIRALAGFGEPLVGRLLMVDARSMRFETLHYAWDPDNPLNGVGVRTGPAAEPAGHPPQPR
jgi:adenylyltransferase/sulfurtransferase